MRGFGASQRNKSIALASQDTNREAKAQHRSDSLFEGSRREIVDVPRGYHAMRAVHSQQLGEREHIAQRGRRGEAWMTRRALVDVFVTT